MHRRSTSTASSGSRSCPATARSTSTRSRAALAPAARAAVRPTTTSPRIPELPKGYIGPHYPGVDARRRRPVGRARRPRGSPARTRSTTTCATRVLGRDFTSTHWADLVDGRAPATRARAAAQPLSVDRGIEVGHVFQLGTKYSEALDAALHRRGRRAAPDGHGLLRHRRVAGSSPRSSRSTTTSTGIAWPAALAPYDVHLVALPGKGDAAAERASPRPSALYAELDARPASTCSTTTATRSPGVKFADADLLGMPVQLIVGAKGLARGVVERKVRATGARRRAPARRASSPTLVDSDGRDDAPGHAAGRRRCSRSSRATCRPATGCSYEPKWDGFRCIVFRDGDEVELGSRNEQPLTRYFPELRRAAARRAARRVRCVDGEIVIATDARARLRPAVSCASTRPRAA